MEEKGDNWSSTKKKRQLIVRLFFTYAIIIALTLKLFNWEKANNKINKKLVVLE